MNKWTKHTLVVNGSPVKVYVNSNKTEAVMFFLFGRYSRLSCHNSNRDVLDFATDFLIGNDVAHPITYSNYVSGQEDTVSIQIEKIAT